MEPRQGIPNLLPGPVLQILDRQLGARGGGGVVSSHLLGTHGVAGNASGAALPQQGPVHPHPPSQTQGFREPRGRGLTG